MLEVVNLTKIYKSKGGDVKALDDVSLRFPEKGMVFLLGKSGSGKSTLLNVCGGLDNPSDGEIIVKGRSSKSFSQSDFDSYRNTFIGFIFQEYNILNEFTVEDNIALALELQGKPKNKQAIYNLLTEVDLVGYAKRKPNTLSGGQKQRIAIARALVKSPEIIMADEPTGALDSATGKQVFDTLKKLSETKLVIVVSHDRDFAEQYGDRIIELKDGKIISDVSKTQEVAEVISSNVTSVGETLCIKSGANLTEQDFTNIKNFLKKSNGNVIISSGEKDVKSFKEVARINDDGEKEVFKNTKEKQSKYYSPSESKFIRSRLPARHAMKIGVSGLKTKPFRLFFTILLCTISFILFSVSSTMMLYDKNSTLKQSLKDSTYDILILNKQYTITTNNYDNNELSYSYEGTRNTKFTKSEFDELKNTFGSATFYAASIQTSITNTKIDVNSEYYSSTITNATFLPSDNALRNNFEGTYPQNDDEIALTSYTVESLMTAGLFDPDSSEQTRYNLSNVNDIIGKKIVFNGSCYTVTGIYNSEPIDGKFDALKEGTNDWTLYNSFNDLLASGIYRVAFFNQKNADSLLTVVNNYDGDDFTNYGSYMHYFYNEHGSTTYFNTLDAKKVAPVYFFDDAVNTIGENDVIVPLSHIINTIPETLNQMKDKETDETVLEKLNSALDSYYNDDYTVEPYIPSLHNSLIWFLNDYDLGYGAMNQYTDSEKQALFKRLNDFIATNNLSFTYKIYFDTAGETHTKLLNIVGVSTCPYESWNQLVYVSSQVKDTFKVFSEEEYKTQNSWYSEIVTKYVEPIDAIYGTVYIPFDRSDASIEKVFNLVSKVNEDDSFVNLNNPIMIGITSVDNMISSLYKVFLILGIVLACFSALLLSNFITVSISYKKKEIGILRAVGARSTDVFKIFFSESMIIATICVFISVIGGFVVCTMLNNSVATLLSGISVFVYGPISIALLIGLALLTTVMATFFPVHNAAKKKPVESIRAL